MEAAYVGGLLVGAYGLAPQAELRIENGWLADVVDAVGLVAEWSRAFPVDVCDVAATLVAVHGHGGPERALRDLMEQWDRSDTRARELLPVVLIAGELAAAVNEQASAEDALHDALSRRDASKAKADALVLLLRQAA